jgi:bifunctional UDP-N-acetylglucosamine pyrophosphorylase/glucosamine-1-phosphate N-acetyltransferase
MQCVILAAGEGKRMRPLTANRPKVMLPLANRPMLEHLILSAKDAGIRDFVLVVGYGEREIRHHFGDGSRLGISISYAPQRNQQGTADALNAARDLVSGTFLMMNGDMILESGEICNLCTKSAPCVAIARTDRPQDYGVVIVEAGKVTALEEKSPRPKSRLINAGAYLFTEEIFPLLDAVAVSSRGEYELTDAIAHPIANGELSAFDLVSWMDVGNPWDLLDANAIMIERMEERREGTIEDGVILKGKVTIGEGTVVRSGTCIEGPCVIGRNCRIGPHAYLRGSTAIGDGCHIGHATEVKNSIVMEGTNIPHFNYVGDSIIGSGCNFGAGTKIANLRHDHATVKVCGRDTRRKKFGAIIGDNVQFGINCSVNVGTVVGANARFAPHVSIEGCIEKDTVIR